MPKTVVIFSTKGGVGKSILAVNLAVSLAADQRKRTCLIDLDTQVPGDMARMLNITTILDLRNRIRCFLPTNLRYCPGGKI